MPTLQRIRIAAHAAVLMTLLLMPRGAAVVLAEEGDLSWKLSGEARFRPEWRDDLDLIAATDDDLRQGFMRLRLGIEAAWSDRVRLYVQAQDSRVAGGEASTVANERNLDLHQGYVDLPLREKDALTLRVGRQEWAYGDQRLIGPFGWDNVGRSFDGLRARAARGRFTVDGLLARVSSVATVGATTGSDLYGVYAQWARRPGTEYEAYWLAWDDHAATPGEIMPSTGTSRVDAFGVRLKDRAGPVDGVVEVVAERGRIGGDDLSASAAAAQAGWSLGPKDSVRLFAGYDWASGDEDPTDGERQEFFNFFPTNHPHYGYADLQGWRNVRSPYAGVSLRAGRHFAQVKAHDFELEEPRGPWKSAGGAELGFDMTGASGRRVGSEIDLTYRFAWTGKAVMEAGYSRFSPGRFARATRRGPDASDWAYVMLTVTF